MIIVGDIASPSEKHSRDLENIFDTHRTVFDGKAIICNFEGLLCDDIDLAANTPVLFNHSSVIKVLKKQHTIAAGLANNHTLDLPACFNNTVEQLTKNHIACAGAGTNKSAAAMPVFLKEGNRDIILFNACWDFLLYHQTNPSGGVYIAEIKEQHMIKEVESLHAEKPGASIIIYLHWSFDLEILPFPMYRQFAKKLIDAGASAVIGTHSHCVQGGEKYNDGYIVYGLGNFFLPYNTFANGQLGFPDFSRMQLAFELNLETKKATCHWFEYQNNGNTHQLKWVGSDEFEKSLLLKKYIDYESFSDSQYLAYFKTNRRKKFLIPVYKDYSATFVNGVYTSFLKNRGKFARMLAKYKVRKWQN